MKVSAPVVIAGKHVRLEPLTASHSAGLARVGVDAEIWRWMPYGERNTESSVGDWVAEILERAKAGTDMPFVVISAAKDQPIGATRYMEIRPEHDALEIGGTWYGASYRRTVVNTECKYLLLQHAFEVMQCCRVQFKTDLRNLASQRAIERIGAKREGILRNHMLLPGGIHRHSVYFSILAEEWFPVKRRLENLLDADGHLG